MSTKQSGRGNGHIRERGNGVFQLVVSDNYKQFYRTVKAATLKDARKALTIFSAEVVKGDAGRARAAAARASEAPTFKEAVEAYLTGNELATRRAGTRRAYGFSLARLMPILGNKRLASITPDDVREAMLAVNVTSTLNTTKLTHGALRRFFKIHAKRFKFISPVETLSDLDLGPAAKAPTTRGALEPEEIAALLNACGDDTELRLCACGLFCRPRRECVPAKRPRCSGRIST
jgi:integrase